MFVLTLSKLVQEKRRASMRFAEAHSSPGLHPRLEVVERDVGKITVEGRAAPLVGTVLRLKSRFAGI